MCTWRPGLNKGKFLGSYRFGPLVKRPAFTSLSILIPGSIVGISDANRTYFGLSSPPLIILSKTDL